VIEKDDDKVLVHWRFLPDSYDRWVPLSDEFQANVSIPITARTSPWHLSYQWLKDSFKYNELMNEEDYELDSGSVGAAKFQLVNEALANLKRQWEEEEAESSKRPKISSPSAATFMEGLDMTNPTPGIVSEVNLDEMKAHVGTSRTKKIRTRTHIRWTDRKYIQYLWGI